MNRLTLQPALDFLNSWLDYRAEQLDFPGFAVAVSHKGAMVFNQAYGMADLEYGKPLTTEHVFCVASQSKMFTATSILLLVQDGKIRLDDTAVSYLPWLLDHRDKRIRELTVRQLLSHMSGLRRDAPMADYASLQEPFPSAEKLRGIVLGSDLVLEPNTAPKYSNLGFSLLGQLIEKVSGQSYGDYVTKHVIEPGRLAATYTDFAPDIAERLPTGYGVPFARQRPALGPRRSIGALVPAMGLHATLQDMCRFATLHCYGNDALLTDSLKKEMQRSTWCMTEGYDAGAEGGLGCAVQHIGERRVVGHTGQLAGHASATFFDPHDRLVVSVAGNCKDLPVAQIVCGIFQALDWFGFGQPTVTAKQLARFQTRACGPTSAVEIVAAGERLAVIDPDDWEPFTWCESLEYIDARTLRITTTGSIQSAGELVQFEFDANGRIKTVRYGGVTLRPEAIYRSVVEAASKS